VYFVKMAESDNQQEELWDESKGARSRMGVRREIGERSSLTSQHPHPGIPPSHSFQYNAPQYM